MSVFRMLMTSMFFLFAIQLHAQKTGFDYNKAWKKIDTLIIKNGQPKTALKEVNLVYQAAKKEKNNPQAIKSLVYRMNLNQKLSENSYAENIQDIEKEIRTSPEPARSILNSIAADYYLSYLQKNRYKFYDRTAVQNDTGKDISVMSIEALNNKISNYYQLSISEESLLQKTKIEPYDAVIIKGNVRALRPTLFDLLAHAALDYFKNDERDITKPAYAFEINDSTAFADAKTFATHRFKTSDSSSLQYRSLLIFQKLIAFHLSDKDPKALIDVDIERIAFVNENAVLENKVELYQKALENIIAFNNDNNTTQALYLLAQIYSDRAEKYDPLLDTTNRFDYLKGIEICERAIKTTDASEGKYNCQILLRNILLKEISLNGELVNVPNAPFRVLVNYRNFTKSYFRVVKFDKKGFETVGDDKYWQTLVQSPAVLNKEYNLPETNDHQHHKVEIAIDALPVGEYALIASTGSDFSLVNNRLAVQYFYVSNISYLNSGNDYYVLDRTTGAPLTSAKLQLWQESYDNSSRSNTRKKGNFFRSDNNGHLSIAGFTREQNNLNIYLDFSYGKDRLFIDKEQYYYPLNNYRESFKSEITYLFTDRSIYRPGQIIYFKGIVVDKASKNKTSVVTDRKSMVLLYDANNTIVDSIKLTTNAYGSYAGKFTLPSNLLNGYYKIVDKDNQSESGFNVEEYKRPKFNVEIRKPSGTYRLGDSIRVEGFAKGYAGNNIDGANVTFTVKRTAVMIFYDYTSKFFPPYERNETEIAHGTMVTDASGKFIVVFKAMADKTVRNDNDASFNYEVSADVTDINGETRSGNTNVTVGYKALKLYLNINLTMRSDSLKTLYISSQNMNDLFETAHTSIVINKLSTPNKIFRERLWEQPDQFIMKKEDYYKTFPFDIYNDETEITKWPSEKNILTATYTTLKDSGFELPNKIMEPGWYSIKISAKDKYDDTVSITKYIQLYNDKINSPFASKGIEANRSVAQPGDQINYRLVSNQDSIFLIHQLFKQNKDAETIILTPNNSKKVFNYTVTESDRGNIAVRSLFVKNNRVYDNYYDLTVPFLNKQLNIDYLTFRDKTLSGTPEKWKVKISGYSSEKVNAEILTSMYDASLDQFHPHSWSTPSVWQNWLNIRNWESEDNFNVIESDAYDLKLPSLKSVEKEYDRLMVADAGRQIIMMLGEKPLMIRGIASMAPQQELYTNASVILEDESKVVKKNLTYSTKVIKDSVTSPAIQPRKNLNETAFFFPALNTDSAGNVEFSFTTPEALTTWKWMLLAHTKDLAFGYSERTMITQKQLMVQPNPPRFLRQGDQMELSAKIVNMTETNLSGKAVLQLTDAVTGENIDAAFGNKNASQNFKASSNQSSAVFYSINVPLNFNNPVTWKIIASADYKDSTNNSSSISDGEEAILPVISNRMLVTETMPLPVKANSTKKFNFEKLLKSGSSNTLQQAGLTVEFTTNPAWYAVQALPYLVEGEKENAEAVFNRFYANALASKIANGSPRFKAIMDKWRTSDTAALLSNLQKNEELKSVLLQETPWVLEAKTETQQKKNIALLFEYYTMSKNLESSLSLLKQMQLPAGAFSWYSGGREDRYMTQYIVTGIGRLQKLNGVPQGAKTELSTIARNAIAYLDKELLKDYHHLDPKEKQSGDGLDGSTIQYLYMRSLFPDISVPGDVFAAYNYFRNLAKKNWIKENSYLRGMIALSLFRTGDVQNATKILTALKENSITSEEMGMYWKDNNAGYYWYQAPVESQAMMIEAFTEISKDTDAVNDMKTWLLKNKQTNSWKTTKATADACYALLLQGADWTSEQPTVVINLGDTSINSSTQKTEAGTGYFKTMVPISSIKPSMGNISVTTKSTAAENKLPAWGAVYWQYFEDLNKITGSVTPLQLNKKLFIVKNTDRGQELQPLTDHNSIRVGDKLKVRIELRADRDMEYLHMKDMRASCMEPVNVLSEYKYQGGLGYYESTKDASTNFYFGNLPKGAYVFEYELTVTHSGEFSNGITTIQCMYAPEFTSHSEGISLKVVKQ